MVPDLTLKSAFFIMDIGGDYVEESYDFSIAFRLRWD